MLAMKIETEEAITLKRDATKLLTRYDKLRLEMRVLEHDLNRACIAYGRSIGVWGFSRDHLRMQLEREKGSAA